MSTAELKKRIVAAEAERSKHPVAFRPDRLQQAKLEKGRRASEEMMSGLLREAGLDTKKFAALQQQRTIELERMVDKHKAEALRRASRRRGTLHPSISAQTAALQALAGSEFFPNPTYSFPTPFLVWTTPLQNISDSAIVPFGSWAKFRFGTSQRRGVQKVSFYFQGTNPLNDYVLINASTFLSATGHLKAHAPWTFGANASSVQATALLNLWVGLPSAVTSSQHGSEVLGRARALSFITSGGDTTGTSISSGVSLHATHFAVPPGALLVMEVALAIEYDNDDGNIDADFESGDFKIACPVVVVSLLNRPFLNAV